jgi:biotin carboxyl carrier protein
MQFETIFNDSSKTVSFNDDFTEASIGDKKYNISWTVQENGRRLLRIGYKLYKIDDVEIENRIVSFVMNGSRYRVEVKNEQDLLLERLGFKSDLMSSAGKVQAPMPGKILELLVSESEEVELGDPVAILEAMKMENELKAPASGQISKIHVKTGESVEKNQPLLEIEPRG